MTPGFKRSLKVNLHRPLEFNGRFAPGNPPTLVKGKNVSLVRNGVGDYSIFLDQVAGAIQSVQCSAQSPAGGLIVNYNAVDNQEIEFFLTDAAGVLTDGASSEISYSILATESNNQQ